MIALLEVLTRGDKDLRLRAKNQAAEATAVAGAGVKRPRDNCQAVLSPNATIAWIDPAPSVIS
jgi:hypothetical protein